MKIAILSDIHANAYAFQAVLNSVEDKNVDALIIAGDLFGYYFEPKAVLRLIQSFEKPVYLVRGNHEEMLLKSSKSPDLLKKISAKYGPGIKIALDQLTVSELEWVANLPHPLVLNNLDCSILLCHGSPFSIDEYIYPDFPVEKIVSSLNDPPDVLIMGHTHYSFVKTINGCLIINPGSVGQPRNCLPGAHWALLDTKTMSVTLLVEQYDLSNLQHLCEKLAPQNLYLREVLTKS
jgi:putative phosphoesterase